MNNILTDHFLPFTLADSADVQTDNSALILSLFFIEFKSWFQTVFFIFVAPGNSLLLMTSQLVCVCMKDKQGSVSACSAEFGGATSRRIWTDRRLGPEPPTDPSVSAPGGQTPPSFLPSFPPSFLPPPLHASLLWRNKPQISNLLSLLASAPPIMASCQGHHSHRPIRSCSVILLLHGFASNLTSVSPRWLLVISL